MTEHLSYKQTVELTRRRAPLRRTLSLGALTLSALSLSACSISDPSLLDPLRRDSGPDRDLIQADVAAQDAPQIDIPFDPRIAVDTCNDPDIYPITGTERSLRIDTRNMNDDTQAACAPSNGPEAFFGVNVQPGEYWHFHLTRVSGDVNPLLYLLPPNCEARQCIELADDCSDGNAEHFAFLPDTPGLWRVVVDSEGAPGGEYSLDVYKPECGNNIAEHGEGCDGTDAPSCVDNCSDSCRCLITPDSTSEKFPNDTLPEANELELTLNTSLTVTGSYGENPACGLPDVYALSIDAEQDLRVSLRDNSGTACSGPDHVPATLELLDSGGEPMPGAIDGNGCSTINQTVRTQGLYYIRLTDPRPFEARAPFRYQLEVLLSP